MAKLAAPSGFRDFLPDAYRKRSELIERIRATYESFGFEGMETPCTENLSVFLGKGGGENEKLMFRVLKRGASLQRALETQSELADMGMRFDLTVPLARYFATHRGELPPIFKRYQIGPVWRAERAQHGRFREFIQCDVDVLGSSSMMVEAEVITATSNALANLGFKGLTVRLNARPLLRALVLQAGVPEQRSGEAIIALDKLDKVGVEEVRKELQERGVSKAAADTLLAFQEQAQALQGEALLEATAQHLQQGDGTSHVEQIREIFALTPELSSGKLVFDPFLARGLDYYTGPIFEIAAEGVPFSLAGGGRFDGLIGKLSGQDIPACGFSIGFERVYTLMEERGMFDSSASAADLLVTLPQKASGAAAMRLGAELRSAGLKVDVQPEPIKMVKQYELAQQKGIAFAVLLEGNEADSDTVTVRNLSKRENANVPKAELKAWVQTNGLQA